MKNRPTIPYILLLGVLVVYSVPAVAEDCADSWQNECGNGECFHDYQKCDKKDDCGNNRDEERCSYNDISACGQCDFICHDQTRCIAFYWVCDEQNDCQDGSDEKDCPKAREEARFLCRYGRTPKPKLTTSSENADTAEATNMTVVPSLPAVAGDCADSWQNECGNGACFHDYQKCDKKDDCGNNRDEERCSYNDISACGQCDFICHDQTRCIAFYWVCDEQNDCQDGSDEKDCPKAREEARFLCRYGRTPKPKLTTPSEKADTAEAASTTSTPRRHCSVHDGDFPCMDGRCLLPVQVCDGLRDCSDGADEGSFCQLVRQGNQQPQQPQQQNGVRQWLADLHLQCRVLPQSQLNSSNAA